MVDQGRRQRDRRRPGAEPAVAELQPGTDATLTVWRDGKPTEMKITTASLPADDQIAAAGPGATPDVPKLGLGLAPVQPGDRDGLGLAEGETGVVVTSVEPDSRAADRGSSRAT